MRSKIKVTIGFCVKNVEATVREALESILAQDFPHDHMELIVVDGCSSDRTLPMIRSALSRTTIQYKILCESQGLGYARNLVVDNARGEYIVWVDFDVILARDYVRKQVEFMEQNPGVGIGRAKYGMCPRAKLVAALENITFVVDSFKYRGEVPLEISGTEGSIYRVKAIRQVGGFDSNIIGAGEDTELAHRIRAAGWRACMTQATFYENCRETWKDLWDEYFWWGYGGHYNSHKDMSAVALYKMVPPAGFLAGLLRFATAYKLTRRKSMILLLVHYTFKRIAWCFGFAKGHRDGYGHFTPRK